MLNRILQFYTVAHADNFYFHTEAVLLVQLYVSQSRVMPCRFFPFSRLKFAFSRAQCR